MPQPGKLNLRVCDDVRQGPRGPLLGRVLYYSDHSGLLFYVAIPFSETSPQAFSTRWDARDCVERRGKPVTDTSSITPSDTSGSTSDDQSPAA